jgi:hypothetical protein
MGGENADVEVVWPEMGGENADLGLVRVAANKKRYGK